VRSMMREYCAWEFARDLRSIGCIHCSIWGSDSGFVTRGDSRRATSSSIEYCRGSDDMVQRLTIKRERGRRRRSKRRMEASNVERKVALNSVSIETELALALARRYRKHSTWTIESRLTIEPNGSSACSSEVNPPSGIHLRGQCLSRMWCESSREVCTTYIVDKGSTAIHPSHPGEEDSFFSTEYHFDSESP
jgi:hypothetical protein